MTTISYSEILSPPRSNLAGAIQAAITAAGGGQFLQFSKRFLSFRDSLQTLPVDTNGQGIRSAKHGGKNSAPDAVQTGASGLRPTQDEFGARAVAASGQYLDLQRPWPAQFTCFVRVRSIVNGAILGVFNNSPNNRMLLFVNSGIPTIRIGSGTSSNTDLALGSTPYVDADFLTAFKWDGTNLTGYINGTQIATVAPTTPKHNTTDNIWLGLARYIGASATSTPESIIHTLLILDRAETGAEIARLSGLIGFGNQVQSVAMGAATNLPTVSGTSPARSPVCTGLARHPSGSGWLVGDDGRYNGSDSSFDAGIIRYSEAFAQTGRFTLASMGIGSGKQSVQGVVADSDGTFWAIAKDTEGSGTVILHANATTGALIGTLPVNVSANGLALDTVRDEFWVLSGQNLRRRSKSTGDATTDNFVITGVPDADHLFYVAGQQKLLLTYGANGVSGGVVVLDVSGATPVELMRRVLTDAVAIEGIVWHDNKFHVANDAAFHPPSGGQPALNRILQYSSNGVL